ncbi:MAG: hypothetical protein QF464_03090, partial [Myxococcota bacterium]|nr:hypothetical protein [Myxococcota bacterium]
DSQRLHATIWEVSTTVDDWNEEAMSITGPGGEEYASVAAIVRPYPSAVAGELVSFTWDKDTGTGSLVYEAEAGGVTEIAAPARLFDDATTLTLTGVEGCWSHDAHAQRLVVHVTTAGTATIAFQAAP